MQKILMLDLEGVLIATAIPKRRFLRKDYGVRPYSNEFLKESIRMFDIIYLNTCVEEKKAVGIMRDVFNIQGIGYYHWDKNSTYGKTSGYEKFCNDKLIHIEDGSLENKEAKHCTELGHIYLPVNGWYPHHAFGPEHEKFKKTDNELLRVLDNLTSKMNQLNKFRQP